MLALFVIALVPVPQPQLHPTTASGLYAQLSTLLQQPKSKAAWEGVGRTLDLLSAQQNVTHISMEHTLGSAIDGALRQPAAATSLSAEAEAAKFENTGCFATDLADSLRSNANSTVEAAKSGTPPKANGKVIAWISLFVNLVVCFAGEYLIKPTLFVEGLFVGFNGLLVLFAWIGTSAKWGSVCWSPLVIAGLGGVAVGAFFVCLLKCCIAFLGGLLGFVASYLILDALPIAWEASTAGLVAFWCCVSLIALACLAAANKWRENILVLATSFLGSFGVAVGIRALCKMDGRVVKSWVFVIVAVVTGIAGCVVQQKVVRPRCGDKRQEHAHLRKP
jgi:hypothetical protein